MPFPKLSFPPELCKLLREAENQSWDRPTIWDGTKTFFSRFLDHMEEKNPLNPEILLFDIGLATENGYLILDKPFKNFLTILWKEEKSCDILVVFGDSTETFPCHSHVVCTQSGYFRERYDSKRYNVDPKTSRKVMDLQELSEQGLTLKEYRRIHHCFYRGSILVPEAKDTLKWLRISQALQFEGLRQPILGLLATYFTPHQAVEVLEKSKKLNQHYVHEVCSHLIEAYDEFVFSKSEVFLNFDLDTIIHFVKNGRFSIPEMDVLRFAVKYCLKKFGKEKGKEIFKKDFEEHIKYPLMQPEELFKKVEPTGWIDSKYLLEAYRYYSISDKLKKEGKIYDNNLRIVPRGLCAVGRFRGSKILDSRCQILLYKFFMETKPKKRRWKMIYSGSKDGWAVGDFHSNCDNKGPTMTIVLSSCGHVFGGYTKVPWSQQSRYQQDLTSWLFHLKDNNSYDAYKCKANPASRNHVYHYTTYGPTFGANFDLYVSNNPQQNNNYSNVGNGFHKPPEMKTNFLSSNRNFSCKELEIFHLE